MTSTLNKQTPGQAARERKLKLLKKQVIEEALERRGFILCECGNCGVMYIDLERAMAELQAHHVEHRGMGRSYNRPGIDDRENIRLLRAECHRKEHE